MAILSVAVALLSLVLAIFGASWLNQRNIGKLLELNQQNIGKLLEQLEKRVDERLTSIEHRLDRIERQLEAIFKPVLPPRT